MKRFIAAAILFAASANPAVADRYADAETAHLLGRFETARRILLPLARKGDKRAQFLLGRQYQMGQGVAKDPVQAYVWYSRAAKQGHAEAGLFKHLLVSKWKMSPSQVAKAEAVLAGKKPSAVASLKPTRPTAAKSPGGGTTGDDRKVPAKSGGDDFGPLGPDPRGTESNDRSREGRKTPTEDDTPPKDPAAKDPAAKDPAAKDPAAKDLPRAAPPEKKTVIRKPAKGADDNPPPRVTAKVVPKATEPTDDEIMRREREADRKAEDEARRRQEAAERQEIEARRRAEVLRREMEENDRAPFVPEEDRIDEGPPIAERWVPSPPIVPYIYRPYFPRAWPFYGAPPPARVYAPWGYPRRAYRARPAPAWRYRYRNNWRQQRRAWRRGYYQRGYNRGRY